MLRLAVFLALFASIRTEDLLGVNYSFDVDFYTHFNSKRCENENMWRVVRYEGINVDPPYSNSDKAIQVVDESCASSFPIIFVDGTLEVMVYSQVISETFYLGIEVSDEDDVCISSYDYRQSSKDFKPGWQTISFKINKHVKGYIHLRGRILKNEILLIDSFQYIPNNTNTYDNKRYRRSLDLETEDEDEIIFNYKALKNPPDNESIESSGDGEYDTELPPPTDQPVIEEPDDRGGTFWNPFTIALVSFAVVVTVIIIVACAYRCGKVRAANNIPYPLADEDLPRSVTIPRVTASSNPASSSRFNDF